ncbi:secondary thiamine-phosphate synthase enzyme YjbQ [bacterium SCSIO 12741]|nr:secondary thiamine-phosphate synthase enzyme YjbQ [bacterium SCSIO 12741]
MGYISSSNTSTHDYASRISTSPLPRGIHLVTGFITEQLPPLPETGLLHLFVKHTSCGITINENADPTVRTDMETSLDQLIREDEPFYRHVYEGPDDMPAHIKSSLVGVSVSLPIAKKQLNLGTWQGIYLCEFRNQGGARKLVATIIGD